MIIRTLALTIFGAALSLGCSDSESANDGTGGESSGGSSAGGAPQGGAGGASEDADGLRKCCIIGAICHVLGDNPDPVVAECHVLGHENDPSACSANFERCESACEGVSEDPVEHFCIE